MANLDTTVIIPSYMKVNSIVECIEGIFKSKEDFKFDDFKVIVVIDGDDDNTSDKLKSINVSNLQVLVLPHNSGKGAAIKAGLDKTDSEYVAFFDADLDIDPSALFYGLNELKLNKKISGIAGCKSHSESQVNYPMVRQFYSFLFRLLIGLLFKHEILDSQTGLKVFRTEKIQDKYRDCRENGFLFELELMIKLLSNNEKVDYIPVKIVHAYDSTINIFSALKILRELMLMKKRQDRGL
jgi:glycosyltransferase involved in cell wall biosynthesis